MLLTSPTWAVGNLRGGSHEVKVAAAGLVIAASLGFASTANATITLTFVGLQNLEPILNYYDGGLGGFWQRARSKLWDYVGGRLACDHSEDNGGTGNFNGAPYDTIAFFQSGPGNIMNRAAGETPGGRPRFNPRAPARAIRQATARSASTVRQTCDRSAGAPARRSLS
jgi:hypothetical protein